MTDDDRDQLKFPEGGHHHTYQTKHAGTDTRSFRNTHTRRVDIRDIKSAFSIKGCDTLKENTLTLKANALTLKANALTLKANAPTLKANTLTVSSHMIID